MAGWVKSGSWEAACVSAGAKIDHVTPLQRRDVVYFCSGAYKPDFSQWSYHCKNVYSVFHRTYLCQARKNQLLNFIMLTII
jgi:hypothetical protein